MKNEKQLAEYIVDLAMLLIDKQREIDDLTATREWYRKEKESDKAEIKRLAVALAELNEKETFEVM